MRVPGPDHPISIEPSRNRVRVSLAGVTVAETDAALVLTEGRYRPVFYVPRADVRWELFSPGRRSTHCPYKGDARHYDLTVGGTTRHDAAWSYERPFPAVAAIEGHLAFYPDKVDDIEMLLGS